MTNQPNENVASENAAKIKRPKGPIRWEAVVPMLVIFALVYSYFLIFFDTHLRHGLQYVGTQGNGAEVNVGSLKTSFWHASLEIRDIQITDSKMPEKNKLEIGTVRWKMLWDALLRKKFVIEEASILNIQLGSNRKSPGRVLPVPPPSPSDSKLEKMSKAALENAEKEFSGNVLGDAAALLNGANPQDQLKSIEASLKSESRIKELQDELKTKEKEWKDRLDKLPQGKDIQALNTRIKSVKTSGFSNPMEVQTSLKELESIFKDADAKFKEIKSTGDALNSDFANYQKSLKDLETLVQQDIKDLESRLKIPKLDADNITKLIFGPAVLGKLQQAQHYMMFARKYMPPKKTPEQKAEDAKPTPQERANGRTYKFGRTNSYPLFLLKMAQISSSSSESELSGDLKGSIQDLTDDQPTLGRPTILKFSGDFPKQQIFGVKGEIIIDHVTEVPVEKLTLSVGKYPVANQSLLQSPEASVAVKEASANATLALQLQSEQVQLKFDSKFTKAQYAIASKTDQIEQILQGTFRDLPDIGLSAAVTGPWSALKFDFDSNIGRELQKGFSKALQVKIDEARAKLKALIDEKIGKEKDKLMSQYKAIEEKSKGLLKDRENEAQKAKSDIDQAKNKAVKDQGKALEGQGQKALEDLKNKFKF